jgi:hypothetical protein
LGEKNKVIKQQRIKKNPMKEQERQEMMMQEENVKKNKMKRQRGNRGIKKEDAENEE